jgi:hypothetical protein
MLPRRPATPNPSTSEEGRPKLPSLVGRGQGWLEHGTLIRAFLSGPPGDLPVGWALKA